MTLARLTYASSNTIEFLPRIATTRDSAKLSVKVDSLVKDIVIR